MKRIFLVLALGSLAYSQSALTSSLSATSATPGGALTLTVGWSSAPFAGIGWTQQINDSTGNPSASGGIGVPVISTSRSGMALKVVTCTPAASKQSCVAVGSDGATVPNTVSSAGSNSSALDSSNIGPGAIASFTVLAPSTPGAYTIAVSGGMASDSTGTGSPLTAAPILSFTVTPPLIPTDLTGDGITNLSDVQAEAVSVLTFLMTGTCANPAGKVGCTIGDYMKVIVAAGGVVHP